MKFLVTGAAGFIGSHSVDFLVSSGHQVVGVDNLRTGIRSNLKNAFNYPNFQFYEIDVRDELLMYSLFAEHEFDGVLHLAALVSVPESFNNPEDNAKINLYATDTIARLCIYFDVPKLVFASSAAVYAGIEQSFPYSEKMTRPISPYGSAKMASEVMLLGYMASHGLGVVCYRYFNVYGPRQRADSPYSGVLSIFTNNFKENKPIIIYGDGKQVRDFIHVSDIVSFNAHALISKNVVFGVYNACTGVTVSLNDIVLMLKEHFPDSAEPQYEPTRIGDPKYSCGAPHLLKNNMGLEARTFFSAGILSLVT